MKLKIILLITAAAFFAIYSGWFYTQLPGEIFIWHIRNDAAELISAILACICAFAAMMLMSGINDERK